jgi:hypothetical protein
LDVADTGTSVEDVVISRIEADRLRREMVIPGRGVIGDRNRAIIERLIAGDTLKEIGDDYGMTKQHVNRVRERCRPGLSAAVTER